VKSDRAEEAAVIALDLVEMIFMGIIMIMDNRAWSHPAALARAAWQTTTSETIVQANRLCK
jgi:hypothetical protein